MSKQMLIDTTHGEETRVVVLDGNRLEDYDVETSSKKQLKGNIYLAKVVRVEPSLQAAFVEYGGNRHGFLAYSEIHPDYYQIPVADRERLIALQEEEARAEEAREEAEDQSDAGGDAADADPQAGAQHTEDQGDEPAARAEEDETDAHEASAQAGGHEAEPETVSGETESEERHPSALSARFLRQYKIQEVIRRRQILLVQVVKEERGNKGAALTTYISLAGRFSVLMPNSPKGGGVSRKITSAADRKRLKEITAELDLPRGMAMIVRTAGAQRPRPEIKRDGEYLLTLWDDIREQTLQAIAPALIYEEANLIKRAIRDVYTRDVEQIIVDGETGWKAAREFMRNLMPANANKVRLWRDHGQPLFAYHQVEHHLDAMLQPNVQLRSGGYLVINQTEALVAIDVNSGRSTRERGIEETALRTNLEAADEVARQLRLRDLAGLIVIDFIDMESRKHNAMVERRLKDALHNDRARIQVGQISSFGLLEMSRQRLRPSLAESSFVACPHCAGTGFVRGIESSALHVLRAVEEEGAKQRAGEVLVHVATPVALYILNQKRTWLAEIERRHNMVVGFAADDSLIPPQSRIDKVRPQTAPAAPTVQAGEVPARVADVASAQRLPANGVISHSADPFTVDTAEEPVLEAESENAAESEIVVESGAPGDAGSEEERRRKRRRRRRRGGRRDEADAGPHTPAEVQQPGETLVETSPATDEQPDGIQPAAPIEAPGAIAMEVEAVAAAPQAQAVPPGPEGPVETGPLQDVPVQEAVAQEMAEPVATETPAKAPARPRRTRRPPAVAEQAPAPVADIFDRIEVSADAPAPDASAPEAPAVADPAPSSVPAAATEAAATPRRRRTTKAAAKPADAEAPPKPARRSRARKAAAPPPDDAAPAQEGVAPQAGRPEDAEAPGAAALGADALDADALGAGAQNGVGAADAPAAPESAGESAAAPVVQPILIDSASAPPSRRTGWWRR